jgi:hypothetical protein
MATLQRWWHDPDDRTYTGRFGDNRQMGWRCTRDGMRKGSKGMKVTQAELSGMAVAILAAALFVGIFGGWRGRQNAVQAAGHESRYSTEFQLTESPISEGERWMGGKTVGLDWGDVSTIPGYASGVAGPKQYADSVALLTGDWATNQSVEEVVDRRNVHGWPEVSMRLRSTLAAHRCDGYEISYSLRDDKTAYLIIVRWNGPLADFTYLLQAAGKQFGVKTGDVVKATIVGNEIKTYKNGVLLGKAKDSTYRHGNPGFGFNEGVNGDYGISRFSAVATDGATF